MKFTRWLISAAVCAALIIGGFFLFGRPAADPTSETVSLDGLCGFYWEEKAPAQQDSFFFYLRPTAKEDQWHLSGSYYDQAGNFLPFEDRIVNAEGWAQASSLVAQNDYTRAERSESGETTVFFTLYYGDGSSIPVTAPGSETRVELYRIFTEAAETETP